MHTTHKKSPRLQQLIAAILVVVGGLSALPALALFMPSNIENIYGLAPIDEHVRLLLQHRALFFGMIGLGIVVSAFKTAWRTPVLSIALLSKFCFVLLVAGADATPEINRVALADGVAIVALGTVLFLHLRSRRYS